MILLNMVLNMIITSYYDLKAGTNALEDYYLFSALGNKPYCKTASHALGVLFAIFYLDVLKYRKL